MEIRLRPEIEELIKQNVQHGSYETVDEFVECAVSMLHEQEVWLARNRPEIEARIEEGFASAQRGELLGAEAVRTRLKELKQERSKTQQR
jgi:Arc/MetJ-type ribon-helix-helix transcriptional regulator